MEFVRARDRLRAAAHGELAEEMVDVRFHRADGDDQRLRDRADWNGHPQSGAEPRARAR